MARDLLDTKLSIMCTEAEKLAVALQTIVEAHPWIMGVGLDPGAASNELRTLASAVRDAEAERAMHDNFRVAARDELLELATAYVADQRRARDRIRALITLHPAPLKFIATFHLRNYTLRSVRVPSVVAQARRVVDDLEGPSALLRTEPAGEAHYQAACVWRDRLVDAFERRLKCDVAVFMAGSPVDTARAELLSCLRKVRSVWEYGRTISHNAYPELHFELASADLARRRAALAAARAEARAREATACAPAPTRSELDGELLR